MIDTVIFDFDNTLEQWIIPEAETEIALAEELRQGYKFEVPEFLARIRELKKGARGKRRDEMTPWDWSRERWLREIFKEFSIDEDPKEYERKYWKFITNKVSLFPNVLKTLKELKRMKIRLMILTDSDGKREFKEKRIKKLGIWDYFDFIITTDDVGVNKPNMRVYSYLIEKTGIDPKKTLIVGDHPESDLVNAKKTGMTTVWDQEAIPLGMKLSYVDYVIKDIIEVVDVVRKENKGEKKK